MSQNMIVADRQTAALYRLRMNVKGSKKLLEERKMSKSKISVPEAKQAMENFKMEAANEVGVNLKQGYNGDLTARQAGSIGGQMVKKMIEDYENKIK